MAGNWWEIFVNNPLAAKAAIAQSQAAMNQAKMEMNAELADLLKLGGPHSSLYRYNFTIGTTAPPHPLALPSSAISQAVIKEFKQAEPRMVQKQTRVPDSINMITGWRTWRISHHNSELRLRALGQEDAIWEPRKKVEAICMSTTMAQHSAPMRSCACGFWAFKSVDMLPEALVGQLNAEDACVVGCVDLWGRVIETEHGFRAQYAYPKELWLLDNSLEDLSWIYGVPVRTLKKK